MTFNLELAKQVRQLIREHPGQHSQHEWSTDPNVSPVENCGTSACIAGWVAGVRGYTVRDVEDGTGQSVALWAGEELGLDEEQWDCLFYELNNERALIKLDRLIETEGEADSDDLDSAAWGDCRSRRHP